MLLHEGPVQRIQSITSNWLREQLEAIFAEEDLVRRLTYLLDPRGIICWVLSLELGFLNCIHCLRAVGVSGMGGLHGDMPFL